MKGFCTVAIEHATESRKPSTDSSPCGSFERMEPSNQAVAQVLNMLKSHTRHWRTDEDLNLRDTIFRQALNRLQREIGLEGTQLAIGVAGHNVDVPEGGDGFEEYATDSTSNAINMYALLVVTPRIIIEASGHIKRDPVRIEPEPTTLWARRRITQVTMGLGIGDRRESGAISTHPELTLRFEDCRSLVLPGWEDELSAVGVAALEEVISEIKKEVFD